MLEWTSPLTVILMLSMRSNMPVHSQRQPLFLHLEPLGPLRDLAKDDGGKKMMMELGIELSHHGPHSAQSTLFPAVPPVA